MMKFACINIVCFDENTSLIYVLYLSTLLNRLTVGLGLDGTVHPFVACFTRSARSVGFVTHRGTIGATFLVASRAIGIIGAVWGNTSDLHHIYSWNSVSERERERDFTLVTQGPLFARWAWGTTPVYSVTRRPRTARIAYTRTVVAISPRGAGCNNNETYLWFLKCYHYSSSLAKDFGNPLGLRKSINLPSSCWLGLVFQNCLDCSYMYYRWSNF